MPGQNYWGQTKPPPGTPIDTGHLVTRGLVAYWPLGDGAGQCQNIWSLSPVSSGGAPRTAVGAHGGACLFAPTTSDKVSSSAITDAIAGRTTATLSAWAYRASTSDQVLWGWTPNNSFRWFVLWANDSPSHVYVTLDGGPGSDASPYCALAGIGWHHIVSTFDGSKTAEARVPTYIDGVAQTLTANGNLGSALSSTANLGPFQINWSDRFAFGGVGRYEDVAVWNRTLTAQEVYDLYTQPYALFAPPVWRRIFVSAAVTTVERRTLSPLGARVGSRQAS